MSGGEQMRRVTPLENIEFYCAGRYGKERFDASYMPLELAEEITRRCVRLRRAAHQDASTMKSK
jgi:hypothetical protein